MIDLALDGITKAYGSSTTPAVEDVSLEVPHGEFFSLLGPSGCGKSTLLRTVAGFVAPDRGSVAIVGRDVTKEPPYRRDTAMVFQSYALFPHLTVQDNIGFGLRYRGLGRAERQMRIGEAIELVRLDGLERRYPSELSGGQQQRVAIARAVATRPTLLLLDEPLSNLDLRLRLQMRSELLRIQRDVGVTTIFVTHDQGEAFSMSDRVAVMNAGRVLQVGSPQDIFERPADAFIVDFIGGSNAIDCVVLEPSPGAVVLRTASGLVITADATDTSGSAVGARVTAYVREEQARLSRTATSPNSFECVVEEMRYFGATLAYVVRAGDERIRVSLPNSRSNLYRVGERAWVSFDPDAVVVVTHA